MCQFTPSKTAKRRKWEMWDSIIIYGSKRQVKRIYLLDRVHTSDAQWRFIDILQYNFILFIPMRIENVGKWTNNRSIFHLFVISLYVFPSNTSILQQHSFIYTNIYWHSIRQEMMKKRFWTCFGERKKKIQKSILSKAHTLTNKKTLFFSTWFSLFSIFFLS